jgi:hypothetical protein
MPVKTSLNQAKSDPYIVFDEQFIWPSFSDLNTKLWNALETPCSREFLNIWTDCPRQAAEMYSARHSERLSFLERTRHRITVGETRDRHSRQYQVRSSRQPNYIMTSGKYVIHTPFHIRSNSSLGNFYEGTRIHDGPKLLLKPRRLQCSNTVF